MNETFEDYCNRKGWSGYTAPLREMWDEWQRDREYLIANICCTEQQRDELLVALKELIEMSGDIPDSNCSCHINPPCNDCVNYSGIREAIEYAHKAIAKAGAQ